MLLVWGGAELTNLCKVLKQKRDAEDRMRRSDPTKNIIIGVNGTGGQTTNNPGDALTVAVESINALTGDVIIAAGTNITLTPTGNTITIDATGGGGSGIFDFGLITESASSSQDWGSLA